MTTTNNIVFLHFRKEAHQVIAAFRSLDRVHSEPPRIGSTVSCIFQKGIHCLLRDNSVINQNSEEQKKN